MRPVVLVLPALLACAPDARVPASFSTCVGTWARSGTDAVDAYGLEVRDAGLRLIHVEQWRDPDGDQVQQRTSHTLDTEGRKVETVDDLNGDGEPDVVQTWSYDDQGRVREYLRRMGSAHDTDDGLREHHTHHWDAAGEVEEVRIDHHGDGVEDTRLLRRWDGPRLLEEEGGPPDGPVAVHISRTYPAPPPDLSHTEAVDHGANGKVGTWVHRTFEGERLVHQLRDQALMYEELHNIWEGEHLLSQHVRVVSELPLVGQSTTLTTLTTVERHKVGLPLRETVQVDLDDDGTIDQQTLTEWDWACE